MTTFDFIVIGGGSAGCVLANRLSEMSDCSVCIIESGPKDSNPLIHVPIMYAFLGGSDLTYSYESIPQKAFNNRVIAEGNAKISDTFGKTYSVPQGYEEKRKSFQPRGKVLGGSSSVNGMLYVRGHRYDYDRWAELGNLGWSYADVLPYFIKSETNESINDEFHGDTGPLNVTALKHDNPFTRYFVEASRQHHRYNPDFNGEDQEGVGVYQVTQKNGQRCSAAVAYLNPAKERKNLTVLTDTIVDKIIFENLEAKKIICITNGEKVELSAKKEIILSGGAYGSPTILMRSGIGDEDYLSSVGVECVHDLKGVGQNLQDHIDYITCHRADSWSLFGNFLRDLRFSLRAPIELLKYLLFRSGMLTSPLAEGAGFIKSSNEREIPDIQLHFCVGMVQDHGRKKSWGNGFSCHMCLLRPESRGTVKIKDTSPLTDPIIDPNYLSVESDMKTMVSGYKKMMEIMNTAPLNQYSEVIDEVNINDDRSIENAIRERSDTIYHPVGTCKMGNDNMAVVDSSLKVHGIKGLRVVDASIMPTLIGGNTNAPSIMIGEKAADMIKEEWQNG